PPTTLPPLILPPFPYTTLFRSNTYWHIMDPTTGRPAENGLLSVTIIGNDGAVCDGLSTALFVMGLEKAVALWQESDNFEAVFIRSEEHTSELQSRFDLVCRLLL